MAEVYSVLAKRKIDVGEVKEEGPKHEAAESPDLEELETAVETLRQQVSEMQAMHEEMHGKHEAMMKQAKEDAVEIAKLREQLGAQQDLAEERRRYLEAELLRQGKAMDGHEQRMEEAIAARVRAEAALLDAKTALTQEIARPKRTGWKVNFNTDEMGDVSSAEVVPKFGS